MSLIIKKLLQHHRQKISALLLAVMVWWFNHQQELSSWFVVYPVQIAYNGLPAELAVASELLTNVKVTLRLKSRQKIAENESFSLIVPMEKMRIGKNTYNLSPEDIIGPNAEVISMVPDSIVIYLDQLLEKQVGIAPQFAEARVFESTTRINLEPTVVRVSGPRSVISNIKQIRTQPIDQKQLLENGEISVNLALPRYVTTNQINEVSIYLER